MVVCHVSSSTRIGKGPGDNPGPLAFRPLKHLGEFVFQVVYIRTGSGGSLFDLFDGGAYAAHALPVEHAAGKLVALRVRLRFDLGDELEVLEVCLFELRVRVVEPVRAVTDDYQVAKLGVPSKCPLAGLVLLKLEAVEERSTFVDAGLHKVLYDHQLAVKVGLSHERLSIIGSDFLLLES